MNRLATQNWLPKASIKMRELFSAAIILFFTSAILLGHPPIFNRSTGDVSVNHFTDGSLYQCLANGGSVYKCRLSKLAPNVPGTATIQSGKLTALVSETLYGTKATQVELGYAYVSRAREVGVFDHPTIWPDLDNSIDNRDFYIVVVPHCFDPTTSLTKGTGESSAAARVYFADGPAHDWLPRVCRSARELLRAPADQKLIFERLNDDEVQVRELAIDTTVYQLADATPEAALDAIRTSVDRRAAAGLRPSDSDWTALGRFSEIAGWNTTQRLRGAAVRSLALEASGNADGDIRRVAVVGLGRIVLREPINLPTLSVQPDAQRVTPSAQEVLSRPERRSLATSVDHYRAVKDADVAALAGSVSKWLDQAPR